MLLQSCLSLGGIEEPPYPVVERKANGEVLGKQLTKGRKGCRYCKFTQYDPQFRYNKSSMQFKPDRAHFCHIRQAVVLRVDMPPFPRSLDAHHLVAHSACGSF